MQQVEDRWSDAVGKRDQYAMELVLAPAYIGVSATGAVTTRNQEISALFVKGASPDSLEQKAVSIRFVGGVLAIVNGTYVMRWKEAKGPVDEKGVFSHVFELTRGGWICLNSQRTVVAVESSNSKKEQVKAKPRSATSDAPLPLHIPWVYKGPASTQPPPQPGSDQPAQ